MDLRKTLPVCADINLSRSHFYTLFKTDMNVSPARYLKALRMEAARELLQTGSLSVKEIGALVGLNDQSHFVRDFKTRYGFTPTEFRRTNFSDHTE